MISYKILAIIELLLILAKDHVLVRTFDDKLIEYTIEANGSSKMQEVQTQISDVCSIATGYNHAVIQKCLQ